MRGSRNFWQGGGGVQTETIFSPQLILQKGGAMVLLQRKLYFLKDPEGVQHFQREERSASFFYY